MVKNAWKRDNKEEEAAEAQESSNWSSLPNDLLDQIFDSPLRFIDHVRLRSICTEWRSFALLGNTITPPQLQSSPAPLLMLQYDANPTSYYRSFFNLYDHKIRKIYIPEARGKYCCGSSQGWLVLLENASPSMSILNPVIGTQIELPPLTTFPGVWDFNPSNRGREYSYKFLDNRLLYYSMQDICRDFISKVVLASNPTSTNYVAMALFGKYNRKLAFCKSGQNKWTLVPAIQIMEDWSWEERIIDNIVHYKGKFYALATCGRLFVCNLDGSTPPSSKECLLPALTGSNAKYLGELCGKLILVVREFGELRIRSKLVRVYVRNESYQKWVRIESIANHALFVGDKSVLASNSARCRANCIYFHRDVRSEVYGIFNMKTGRLEPFPSLSPLQFGPFVSATVWFRPSLC